MHKYDNYHNPESDHEGAFKAWKNDGVDKIDDGTIEGKFDEYRYVDVVFENDGNKKHQYVVPFMIVDNKDLHYLPTSSNGFNAAFTDNRYGQVYQSKDQNPSRKNKKSLSRLSPIEPYIRIKGGVENPDVRDSILLNKTDKIVCMRVYKRKYDPKNDRRHFLDIRDDESEMKLDCQDGKPSVLSDKDYPEKGIIVDSNNIIKYKDKE